MMEVGYSTFAHRAKSLGLIGKVIPTVIYELPDEVFFGTEFVAELFNVSAETPRRWCRNFQIEHIKSGRKYAIIGQAIKDFWFISNYERIKVEYPQLISNNHL